jgi:hypothetical protein
VSLSLCRKVAEAFELLRRLDPFVAGVSQARVAATRARAVALHWPTEWAFDELEFVRDGHSVVVLDVDDPSSVPEGLAGGVLPEEPKPWIGTPAEERFEWFAATAAAGVSWGEALQKSGAPSERAVIAVAQRAGVADVKDWFSATEVKTWRKMSATEKVTWFAEAAVSGMGFAEAVKLSGAPSEGAAVRAVERAGVAGLRRWFEDERGNAIAFLNEEEAPARASSEDHIEETPDHHNKEVKWLM